MNESTKLPRKKKDQREVLRWGRGGLTEKNFPLEKGRLSQFRRGAQGRWHSRGAATH